MLFVGNNTVSSPSRPFPIDLESSNIYGLGPFPGGEGVEGRGVGIFGP